MTFRFHAAGTPQPQGSKRHVGKGRIIETNKNLRPWRDTITWEATQAAGDNPTITGPVQLELVFTFPRPKHHYRTGRHANELKPSAPYWHTVKPDLDKLTRAVCDALTTARVINDDQQVAQLTARKRYGDRPGVHVTVYDQDLGFNSHPELLDELVTERYA